MPRVIVDGVEAVVVVEIGGQDDKPEIIHTKDDKTGETDTKVVNKDGVNKITEQEKEDEAAAVAPPSPAVVPEVTPAIVKPSED